jgi:hypothetical protein
MTVCRFQKLFLSPLFILLHVKRISSSMFVVQQNLVARLWKKVEKHWSFNSMLSLSASCSCISWRVALGLRTGSHEVTWIHKLWCCHLLHSLGNLHGHHRVLGALSGTACILASRLALHLLSEHLLVKRNLLLLNHHLVLHHLNQVLRGILLCWVRA